MTATIAKSQIAEARNDLAVACNLLGRVAIATHSGRAIDAETYVDLLARVVSAIEALETADASLTEHEVQS